MKLKSRNEKGTLILLISWKVLFLFIFISMTCAMGVLWIFFRGKNPFFISLNGNFYGYALNSSKPLSKTTDIVVFIFLLVCGYNVLH